MAVIQDIETENVFSYFQKRRDETNKGSFGRALLICGSYGMAGAAVIAGQSCIHSGVGIADIVCEKSVYPIISSNLPEAVFTPVSNELCDNDVKAAISAIKKADCIAIGCGMGQTDYTRKLLNIVIDYARVPIIIDADGINCLAECIELLQSASSPVILTPHPGEMSRLIGKSIGYIMQNRRLVADCFSNEYNVTLVLKGHETIVACKEVSTNEGENTNINISDNTLYINHSGNAGMATAGSGDMLCGMIAAFIAQGLSASNAAVAGVHFHGLCGDICAKKYSMMYTTPTTMLKVLPAVFLQLEEHLSNM